MTWWQYLGLPPCSGWFGADYVVAGAWGIYRHIDKKINEELGG